MIFICRSVNLPIFIVLKQILTYAPLVVPQSQGDTLPFFNCFAVARCNGFTSSEFSSAGQPHPSLPFGIQCSFCTPRKRNREGQI
jgi:hypothetical protein